MLDQKNTLRVFTAAGIIGVCFGVVYAFWGLGILPVQKDVLVPWGNGVYGATFIGLSAAIFFVGRQAFRSGDRKMMQALFNAIASWLVIEFLFSIYYRVFFNAGVDVALLILLGYPLRRGILGAKDAK
ncbi:MAG TPA: hypothetical protein VL500_03215 [Candidatus Eisenbacteria bacterium]|jgi:hypothetical protein|nr:hypothetical protein [Candidatus Eisenbacteria bacterium]